EEGSVRVDLVDAVHGPRPEERRALGVRARHRESDPIPGISQITWMALFAPARHIAFQPDVAVVCARQRREVHRLPVGIVEPGIGPAEVVADVETPGAAKGHERLTERDGYARPLHLGGTARGARGAARKGRAEGAAWKEHAALRESAPA